MKKATVVIQDTSILIDLVNGGVLGAWFRLGIATVVTDFVLNEVQDGPQWTQIEPMVGAGILEVASVPDADATRWYGEIAEISRANGISIADASTYLYAREHRVPLLTGDWRLRAISLREDLEVRGILWILDELVAATVLNGKVAASALCAMLEAGARLPQKECEQRVQMWSGTDIDGLQNVPGQFPH